MWPLLGRKKLRGETYHLPGKRDGATECHPLRWVAQKQRTEAALTMSNKFSCSHSTTFRATIWGGSQVIAALDT
jgi:hypothetical protein